MEGQWFSRDLERNILEHGNWSQLVKIALRAPEAPLDPEIIHLSSYQSYDFFFFPSAEWQPGACREKVMFGFMQSCKLAVEPKGDDVKAWAASETVVEGFCHEAQAE